MCTDCLAKRCQEELDQFLRREASAEQYGYELFRRMLDDRCDEAWSAALAVYERLVLIWVRSRHSGLLEEEEGYYLNRAFERLFQHIGQQQGKFASFPPHKLKPLIRYLKLCTVNAMQTPIGRAVKERVQTESLDNLPQSAEPAADFVARCELRGAFWTRVRQALKNEREQVIVLCCFYYEMRPREVRRAFPSLFDTDRQVSNLRTTILRRLARISDFEETLRGVLESETLLTERSHPHA